jgi:Fe-S cluster assembly iron-binding protein IscA
MDIQIKSSRVVLATDSAVSKLKELKDAENADESFLRMGVKPGGCSGFILMKCFSILKKVKMISQNNMERLPLL